MKLATLTLFTLPTAVLACGGFFYPAPPSLEHFPERLPVKTLRELLRDSNPPPADAATFDQLDEEVRAIAAQVGTTDQLLARIDKALARNRTGDYRKRFANCLYDLRDLLSQKDAPAAEAAAYAAWRTDIMGKDDGFFRPLPSTDSWNSTPEENAEKRRAWQADLKKTGEFFETQLAKAAPALQPHWLVQAGAWRFKLTQFDEAAQLFQKVIEQSPEHPRAEVARLMLARTRMEQWQAAKKQNEEARQKLNPDELHAKYKAADEAFEEYLKAHPKGRFVPDIVGWRSGMQLAAGAPALALAGFLQQLDEREHPEVVRRAVRECEACLNALDAKVNLTGDDAIYLPLEEIARRPLAALAVVYHFLDSESRHDFEDLLSRYETMTTQDIADRYLQPALRLRKAGRRVLPDLVQAVVREKANYGGAIWQPRYLTILAWAASEVGQQGQAIALCDLAGDALAANDDLLFVRAVALQRDAQWDAALAAFRKLQEKFPESPLNADTRFRIATILRDQHESGAAAVELLRMCISKKNEQRQRSQQTEEPTAKTVPALRLEDEIAQWADTLLQFAPLPELARGLSTPNLEPPIASRLRDILRMRHLAREDFTAALKLKEPPPKAPPADGQEEVPEEPWPSRFNRPTDPYKDNPAAPVEEPLQTRIQTLARLTKESQAAGTPATRAEKLFALAETWAKARGRLTLPSVDDFGASNYHLEEFWDQRQRNAKVAGFSDAAQEMEGRDELRHAHRYYLQAADAAPGTPLAARSLWLANDAIRRIAELSPWAAARAFETRAGALSQELHQKLLRQSPGSNEAKRSVWWSFPMPAELPKTWLPGEGPAYEVEVDIAKAFGSGMPAGREWIVREGFSKRFTSLVTNAATWDTPKLLAEIQSMQQEFRKPGSHAPDTTHINHLDDLALLLQQPGLTPATRAKYFAARLAEGPPNLDDPDLAPFLDFATFLALVREGPVSSNPQTGERTFRPMPERMREFLNKFPKSPKREAALARLAIATVRQLHGHAEVTGINWPEAPLLDGYRTIGIAQKQPFEAAPVFAALDAYETEFPNGRYSAEMRLWRGAAAINTANWKLALKLLTETLDDPSKPDLHLDAALNLANIFCRLLDQPEARGPIIEAMAENASAQKRLKQFMESDTPGARLRCLEGYLAQRFKHESA